MSRFAFATAFATVAAIVLVAAITKPWASTPTTRPATTTVRARHVLDGDTFTTTTGERIRLFGIDAPESHETGGSEAKVALHMLLHGVALSCEPVDVDRYGRTVAVCHRVTVDRADVGAALVRSGHARVLWRWARLRPGYVEGLTAPITR